MHNWPFVRGIHRSLVDSPHKGPVMQKVLPHDDIIMCNTYCSYGSLSPVLIQVVTGASHVCLLNICVMFGHNWHSKDQSAQNYVYICICICLLNNICSLTYWPLGDLKEILNNFHANFSDQWLRYLMWNCPLMNFTGLHWWSVNIGSGNGLVPSGNKPLPGPMLTQISVAIWRH